MVPKTEVDHFYDLPEPYYSAIFQTAKKLAPTLQKATKSKRISMFLIGLDVPHVHIHLVPTNTVDDIQKNATHQESEEAMKQIQQAIISYL
ncbi:MAG: HIT domain-containing protein [bacterium]|nr:HIT domain-containing protein [bacterium]